MKKIFAGASFLLLMVSGLQMQAQNESPSNEKKSEEIIIKKNGDKDLNMTIRIHGDDITVNGKPLSEFNEDGVTINKKKIIINDGDGSISVYGSPYLQRDFSGTSKKVAFLGVATEADKSGALIKSVTEKSAAENAGLQKGDIITKVGDETILTPDDLSKAIKNRKPNDEVKISFLRNGKKKTAKVTLGERTEPAQWFSFSGPDGGQYRQFSFPPNTDFSQLQDMLGKLKGQYGDRFNFDGNYDFRTSRRKLGLKIQDTEDESGVKVLAVEDSSAAKLAGIKEGDIITGIGNEKISNTDDMREELDANRENSKFTIKATRNGKEVNFDINFPKKLKTANL